MALKRLSFSIDKMELFETPADSHFAIARIDAFASGDNAHELYVSEETLKKAAPTILSKPVIWMYDPILDDIGTHDQLSVPCGFIPDDSRPELRKLEDGRTMLTVIARIWKKYSGEILSFFQRDGDKPVSVEIDVIKTAEREGGGTELMDFCFAAIAVLGTFVIPAIPLAGMEILQFAKDRSKEYKDALDGEFSSPYKELDFAIPANVKRSSQMGLNLHTDTGRGGTGVSLAMAEYLAREDVISPEMARQIFGHFEEFKGVPLVEFGTSSGAAIEWMLWGGSESSKWLNDIVAKMDAEDEKKASLAGAIYREPELEEEPMEFSEEEKKDAVTESIVEEEESVEETVEMAEKKEEKKEDKKEEKPQPKEGDDKEDENEKDEEFSLDSYLDVAATLAFLREETEANEEMAAEDREGMRADMEMAAGELEKGKDGNFGCIMKGMFAKMRELSLGMAKMKEELKTYMAENEELKEFKSKMEKERFEFEVGRVLKEVEESMPPNELETAREDAAQFTLETIDAWANKVRAKAFTFSKDKEDGTGTVRIGLPWGDVDKTKKGLWE